MLALIPARGGSKGIPRKNLSLLGGRPLLAWSIEAALSSGVFERVVVSTDDPEIAELAVKEGAEVPFMRPDEYAGDEAPAIGVVRHALKSLYNTNEHLLDTYVTYLQPTSPFRSSVHLQKAVMLVKRYRPDTLVSVQRVPHSMVTEAQMNAVGDDDVLYLEMPLGQIMQRQKKSVSFARNGPAILIVSSQDVLKHNRLYGRRVLGFEMDEISSLDIDEPIDLDIARALLPLALSKGL